MTPDDGVHHTLNRDGGDVLEQILRNVESDIDDAHGWDADPFLLWVQIAGRRKLAVVEVSSEEAEGETLSAALDAFADGLDVVDPSVLAVVLTVEAVAVLDGEEVDLRQVFGVVLTSGREMYLVRRRGDAAANRFQPPEGDPTLMALRRLVRRAAALRDPIRVPEEWS